MEDRTLFKLSAIVSIIGIILLLLIFYGRIINQTSVNNIDLRDIDSTIKISGNIESLSGNQIKLKTSNYVQVSVFNSNNISIKKGDFVEIIGEISEYEGIKMINANRIILKS